MGPHLSLIVELLEDAETTHSVLQAEQPPYRPLENGYVDSPPSLAQANHDEPKHHVTTIDHQFSELCQSIRVQAVSHLKVSSVTLRPPVKCLLPQFLEWSFRSIGSRSMLRIPADGSAIEEVQVEILEAGMAGSKTSPARFPDLSGYYQGKTMERMDYQVMRTLNMSASLSLSGTYIMFKNMAMDHLSSNKHFRHGGIWGDAFIAKAVENLDVSEEHDERFLSTVTSDLWNKGLAGVMYDNIPNSFMDYFHCEDGRRRCFDARQLVEVILALEPVDNHDVVDLDKEDAQQEAARRALNEADIEQIIFPGSGQYEKNSPRVQLPRMDIGAAVMSKIQERGERMESYKSITNSPPVDAYSVYPPGVEKMGHYPNHKRSESLTLHHSTRGPSGENPSQVQYGDDRSEVTEEAPAPFQPATLSDASTTSWELEVHANGQVDETATGYVDEQVDGQEEGSPIPTEQEQSQSHVNDELPSNEPGYVDEQVDGQEEGSPVPTEQEQPQSHVNDELPNNEPISWDDSGSVNEPVNEQDRQEPQVLSPEPQVLSPEPQVPSPEPQVPSPELQVPSPEPQVPSPELQVPSPEPQVPSQEPQVPSQEPKVPSEQPASNSIPDLDEWFDPAKEARAEWQNRKKPRKRGQRGSKSGRKRKQNIR
ncbi:hypothetical protein ACLMJK_008430 [Lecanora helva]